MRILEDRLGKVTVQSGGVALLNSKLMIPHIALSTLGGFARTIAVQAQKIAASSD